MEAADRWRAGDARHLGGGTLLAAGDKREHWERLLSERKLGALALLRNLRNMKDAGVGEELVVAALWTR